MNRVVVVTGSLPPDVCGCGEYAHELIEELRRKGRDVEVFYRRDWRFRHVLRYLSTLRASRAGVINMQYPTQGYGWSILPQILSCLAYGHRKVVTLHEYSQKRIEAKLAIYLFFLTSDWVVFTSEAERENACRLAPWLRARSSVIPICSNIPFRDAEAPDSDVVYFGLIHPSKGIETFRETIGRLQTLTNLKARVIGQVVPAFKEYAEKILPALERVGCEIILNRSAQEVSNLLARARVALLPFPDGITKRRGSALAAMGNGALVVTTPSKEDKEFFQKLCVMTESTDLPTSMANVLANFEDHNQIRIAGQEYARSISWASVADSYIRIFDRDG